MIRHPAWCSPAHCNVDSRSNGGGTHESEHLVMQAMRAHLYRPGHAANAGTRLLMEIHEDVGSTPAAVVVLTPRQALGLVSALTQLLLRSVAG